MNRAERMIGVHLQSNFMMRDKSNLFLWCLSTLLCLHPISALACGNGSGINPSDPLIRCSAVNMMLLGMALLSKGVAQLPIKVLQKRRLKSSRWFSVVNILGMLALVLLLVDYGIYKYVLHKVGNEWDLGQEWTRVQLALFVIYVYVLIKLLGYGCKLFGLSLKQLKLTWKVRQRFQSGIWALGLSLGLIVPIVSIYLILILNYLFFFALGDASL